MKRILGALVLAAVLSSVALALAGDTLSHRACPPS